MFNAEDFLNQTTAEPMATSFQLIPEGEYLARLGTEPDDIKVESVQGKKDPSKTYVRLTLQWDILDENLKQALGRDRIRIRDQFLIDVDSTTGLLEFGPDRNISLGQRRAALKLNDGTFSLAMFRGAGPAMIRVGRDSTGKYAEVSRVVAIG